MLYRSALAAILLAAACSRSIPRTSGQSTEVDQHVGRHFLGYRFPAVSRPTSPTVSVVSHWNSASSSLRLRSTSAIAKFFGVWNCSQSRSMANARRSAVNDSMDMFTLYPTVGHSVD